MGFWETFAWVFGGVLVGLGMWLPVIVLMWRDIKWEEAQRNGTDNPS